MEKTLDLKMPGAIELDRKELKEVDGGFIQFLLGAIAGGILYDAYKQGIKDTFSGERSGSLYGEWGPR